MWVRRLLLVALVHAASFAGAQEVKFEKYRLSNGLTVILHEDHTVPLATINTWFDVGSKDEAERRSGFAHLFEHLMFMGTERAPGSTFDQLMEQHGGWNNATTSEDRTNYFSFGPSNLLKTLLWLDADRLEDLGRMMDQKKLDLQREVVRNERRQNVELQPYGEAYERLPSMLYQKGHPYHTSVIGSHEDLQNATVQDVKDFYATFYVPNNASLVVAGDFDSRDIKPYIQQVFGTLPRQNEPPRRFPVPAKLGGVRKATLVDNVPHKKVMMAWLSPSAYTPGDIAMSVAGQILASGVSSRMYQRLVVDKKLSTEVSAYQNSLLHGSYFMLEANTNEKVTLEQVEREMDAVIREFCEKGPTLEELRRQSAATQTEILRSLQSISDKADQMNAYEFYWGDPNGFKRHLNLIRAITPQSMAAVCKETLNLNQRVLIRVIPKPVEPDRVARDTKPEVGAEKGFTVPHPTPMTVHGIPVYYFHRPEVPLMEISARIGYGADHDPAAKSGTAALMAEMLTSGYGTLDSAELASQLELLGASLWAAPDRTGIGLNLSSMAANFTEALAHFAGALSHSTFAKAEFDRIKDAAIAQKESELEDPASIAPLVASREFFGSSHPASRPITGTLETVRSISLEDVKVAYGLRVGDKNLRIVAAGSLAPAEFQKQLSAALANVKKGEAVAPPTYPKIERGAPQVFLVDVPNAPQTVIRFLMPGVNFDDPRRLAFGAVGTVLGGTFTSRLNANLREAKGYTYGAGASSSSQRAYGTVTASSSVRADVTGAALKEFLAEFAGIRSKNVVSAEASKARSSMRADFVSDFASLRGTVGTMVAQLSLGSNMEAVQRDLTALSSLTEAELNAVAGEFVPTNGFVLVLVGDRKSIEPQLAGLGLPEVKVVKATGG